MATLTSVFNFSVGKKLIMGLSGLFLISFLVVHLAGNLLLFVGPAAFNDYAIFMGHTWFIRIAEVILFAGFTIHIYDGISLWIQNHRARPVKYAVRSKAKTSSWASRNMKWTGTILLVFLILHLLSFFLGARFGVEIGIGIDMDRFSYRDVMYTSDNFDVTEASLWHKTAAQFAVEWYSIIYILAMGIIGFHLVHGFQSAFQTLGIKYPRYAPIIDKASLGFAVLVPAAFATIPIYFLIIKYTGYLDTFFAG
ncbi:MAG: succinate dehydrogenase cytochrome b subunit [Bacteroidota bacterium]